MANVITYGTYDLFHIGHLKLLQRARDLGGSDGTLTVVVSSDKFNWEQKGKRCAIPDYQRAKDWCVSHGREVYVMPRTEGISSSQLRSGVGK